MIAPMPFQDQSKFGVASEGVTGKKEALLLANEEYFEKIVPLLEALRILNKEAKAIAVKIIGKNLLKEDLCLCAVLDRICVLLTGLFP